MAEPTATGPTGWFFIASSKYILFRSNASCLTSILYVDTKQKKTYVTSVCKNDPGRVDFDWSYIDRKELKCCDRRYFLTVSLHRANSTLRYSQEDDYTCAYTVSTAVQSGRSVYTVFKPK